MHRCSRWWSVWLHFYAKGVGLFPHHNPHSLPHEWWACQHSGMWCMYVCVYTYIYATTCSLPKALGLFMQKSPAKIWPHHNPPFLPHERWACQYPGLWVGMGRVWGVVESTCRVVQCCYYAPPLSLAMYSSREREVAHNTKIIWNQKTVPWKPVDVDPSSVLVVQIQNALYLILQIKLKRGAGAAILLPGSFLGG